MSDIKPMIFNLEYLEQNAKNGDGLSSYILGRSYFSEEMGALRDYNKAFEWYKYGSDVLNDPRCTYGLGICYDDGVGGVKQDHEVADSLFRKALNPLTQLAKMRDPFSMFILGAYYFYGFAGVDKNDEKAFDTIYKAAMLGHLAGIYDIGTFYHNGVGIEVDYDKSKEFLQLASDFGLKRATDKLEEWKNDFSKHKQQK